MSNINPTFSNFLNYKRVSKNKKKQKIPVKMEADEIGRKKPMRHFFLLSPPVVLIDFSFGLAMLVLTDLVVYKTCVNSLNFNETDCLQLGSNSSSEEARNLEAQVEPYASLILMVNELLKTLLPAILCLFLGPWSDRGGRRIPLLAAMTGITLMFVLYSVMCEWDISPWYLLIAAIPANIVGSVWSLKMIFICYASDTTIGRARMLQIALLEASTSVGSVLGTLAAPLIYKNYGSVNVFRVGTVCFTLSLVYTYFCIPETVKNASKESMRSFFKISLVKDLVTSVLRRRDGFDRLVIWSAIVVIAIDAIIRRGETTIQFLFTRVRLGWDVEQFSYFNVAESLLRIIGLGLLSLRRYSAAIPDTLLAAISNFSAFSGSIAISLVWKSWHMYLSSIIGVLSAIAAPVSRSVIAKFVPAEDVGKVFSLVSFLEILSSSAGSPLYTMIYTNYLPPVYPSPVHLLSSCLLATSIICVIFIHLRIRKCKKGVTYVAAPQRDSEP